MQEFIDIFAQMGWASAILLVFGGLLLVAEALTPGFNLAGISGFICLVLGIVARVAEGATLTQTLLLILLITIIVLLLFILFVKSAKNGIISKTSIIETGTAIPDSYGKLKNENLLNKTGITTTLCKPVGKVKIGGRVYDAITAYGYIEANTNVIVEKVGHDYLYLKKFSEADIVQTEEVVEEIKQEQTKQEDIVETKQKKGIAKGKKAEKEKQEDDESKLAKIKKM